MKQVFPNCDVIHLFRPVHIQSKYRSRFCWSFDHNRPDFKHTNFYLKNKYRDDSTGKQILQMNQKNFNENLCKQKRRWQVQKIIVQSDLCFESDHPAEFSVRNVYITVSKS